nr:vacuolar protein-sorting protein bro1 [Quercus suber]
MSKKAISSQENALFKSELEKFRQHQNRILQANHKQQSLMKELTRVYSDLLQDKRVRSEQNKYESFSRQRNTVLGRYRKVYQAYQDLQAGLARAQGFYDEMKETVESMKKNVESFVENRRSEGGQLLSAIEAAKGSGADREQARLKDLMERMSMSPSNQTSGSPVPSLPQEPARNAGHRPPPLQPQTAFNAQPPSQPIYNPAASPPVTPRYPGGQNGVQSPQYQNFGRSQPTPTSTAGFRQSVAIHAYNPNSYGPVSPPPNQQFFSPPPGQPYGGMQQTSTPHYGHQQQQQQQQQQQPPQHNNHYSMPPPGWQPPPPPPGPPPSQDYSAMQSSQYPAGPGGYASDPRRNHQPSQSQNGADPWAGLSGWK